MGDPKRLRKKYSTPNHPWNKDAIDSERVLMREYGLKNKRELYIADSFIRKYRKIAKSLIVDTSKQAVKEKEQMLNKLKGLGLLTDDAGLGDVLSLEIKDILERRLQTLVFRKGLARTMNQSRQFIVHRHVAVEGKEINAASYLVPLSEEAQITFKDNSALFSEDHPERVDHHKDIQEEAAELKKAKQEHNQKGKKSEDNVVEGTVKDNVKKQEKVEEPVKEEKETKVVESKVEESPVKESKEEVAEEKPVKEDKESKEKKEETPVEAAKEETKEETLAEPEKVEKKSDDKLDNKPEEKEVVEDKKEQPEK